jgi:CBS domain containing-hemolysin-like protein
MKTKDYKEKYSNKAGKKPVKNKKLVNYNWILKITVITFAISLVFSFISETVIPNVNIFISIILVLVFIGLGILFDIIGVSITVADPKTFHSMAAKNVRGAKLAVKLIKNAEKVSSFCNDVIGDICGIISGSTSASIAIILSSKFNWNLLVVSLIITALVASMTIGGKAIGKSIAINKSNAIIFRFSSILSFVYRK